LHLFDVDYQSEFEKTWGEKWGVYVVDSALFTLSLALVASRLRLEKIALDDLPFFFLLGTVGIAGNYTAYFYALCYTTVAMAVILLYIYPAIVAILSRIFLRENPEPRSHILRLRRAHEGL